MNPVYIGAGIIVLILLVVIYYFNKFVRMRNRVKNAWSQIDVQLKRRYDLIPNLMETVKGYMKHERETLESVTKARAAMAQAKGPAAQAQADNMLTGALKSLFAVSENYPDLKASDNFKMLQEELTGTENKIAYARQFYNDITMAYNVAIQTFPGNIFAGIFGHKEQELFEVKDEKAREAVKVSFD